MISKDYRWYVAYTKNQHEKRVNSDSFRMNITSYLPLIKTVRCWSDRKKCIEVPLFPNYIFLKLSCKEYTKILEHPSIIGFVKLGSDLSTISEKQLESIRAIVDEKLEYYISPINHCKGSFVKIITGPMKGFEGEVVNSGKGTYAVIQLKQIHQSIFVKIDKESILACN